MLTNDLIQIQTNYHGWTDGETVYISDELNDKEMEETIVHELAHCLEIEQQHLKILLKDEREYELLDEVFARAAEFEYNYPDRRITRSITKNIREMYVPDDY